MKKKLLQLFAVSGMLVATGVQSNAQWTETATSVYLTNGTKPVGIGTTAPGYPLDIKQQGNCNFRVQSITSGSSNLILARSAAAGTNCLVNYKTGTTALWYTGVAGSNTDFRIRNGIGTDNVFISQATGFVGINNVAPTVQLEVTGTGRFNGNLQVTNNSTFGASMGVTGNVTATGNLSAGGTLSSTGNATIGGTLSSTGDATIGGNLDVNGTTINLGTVEQLSDAGANTIGSNSDLIPTIDGGNDLGQAGFRWGNVLASNTIGVGVTSAASKLHVDGGTDVSPAAGGYITIGPVTGANIGMDNNEIMARNNGLVSPLYLQNSGGDLVLCSASGNVSIGTSVAATGYILSVDGKVMAEEVRVELSQNWPDYVFNKEYKLMSIEALEQHVNEFKHLPGIPSATEIAENGISLGEMQTKTIEKVEENSLYIIELNNKIEAQNNVIAKLIKEIETLKNNK